MQRHGFRRFVLARLKVADPVGSHPTNPSGSSVSVEQLGSDLGSYKDYEYVA